MSNSFFVKLKNRAIAVTAECVRRLKHSEKYVSLNVLYEYLGDSVVLNDKAKRLRKTIITQICTKNSWYIPRNCLFLIYRNPVYKDDDTEKMADFAMKRGAAVLITNRSYKDYPCMISSNPLEIYARLCRFYRDLTRDLSVIAVSGSIGKTTVKNMIVEVCKMKYRAWYTSSNMNTKEVVGFTAQHIPNWAEKLIQEIHEGEPNETQFVSEMICPDILAITPIEKSHLLYFGDAVRIVEEVCSITKNMRENGKVIVNIDEFDRFDLLNGKAIVSISVKDSTADYYADGIQVEVGGLSFTVHEKSNGDSYSVRLNNVYALHNVSCALYAIAAGRIDGIDKKSIVQGLLHFRQRGVRQNILKADNGVLIYADCYNAIDRSMKSAIDTASLMDVRGNRIAVLGDIEECGDLSDSIHLDVVNYIIQSNFDVLYVIGEKMAKAIKSASIRDSLEYCCFRNLDDLAKAIKSRVRADSLVLFKGSHANNLGACILKVWPQFADEVKYYSKESRAWKLKSLFY